MASERMMMVLLRPSMHHINTIHDDATKNHDGAATQRTLKYGGWNSSKAGNEASLEYDQSTGDDGTTIDQPSHGHKTYILAERGRSGNAKHTGYKTYQTIASNSVGNLL